MSRSLSRTRGTAAALVLALPAALLTIGRGGRRPRQAGRQAVGSHQARRRRPAAPARHQRDARFGWLPQDVDANEVQTAYKIVVRDADGALVWDTDKVKPQQAYVEYDGAPTRPRQLPTPGGCGPGTRQPPVAVVGVGVVRDRLGDDTGATPRGSGGRRAIPTPVR